MLKVLFYNFNYHDNLVLLVTMYGSNMRVGPFLQNVLNVHYFVLNGNSHLFLRTRKSGLFFRSKEMNVK